MGKERRGKRVFRRLSFFFFCPAALVPCLDCNFNLSVFLSLVLSPSLHNSDTQRNSPGDRGRRTCRSRSTSRCRPGRARRGRPGCLPPSKCWHLVSPPPMPLLLQLLRLLCCLFRSSSSSLLLLCWRQRHERDYEENGERRGGLPAGGGRGAGWWRDVLRKNSRWPSLFRWSAVDGKQKVKQHLTSPF